MQNQTQSRVKDQQHIQKGMMDAGMDIISENQRRKNWKEAQLSMQAIEPELMQIRKHRDKILREEQERRMEKGSGTHLPKKYLSAVGAQIKMYQEELHTAVLNGEKQTIAELKTKVATLQQTVKLIKDNMIEFQEDHFQNKKAGKLSRGVSQQQISFATQMYCENPDLIITFATKPDVLLGQKDYYGNLVRDGELYAIVYDFSNNPVLVNVLDGNKDMFIVDIMKATEYMNFGNELGKEGAKARENKTAVKINLNKINRKMDVLFGLNDGTATKEHDQLVLMFAHDDAILEDHNTFKRHLYEYPNIQNINYGDFNFDTLEYLGDLGPGDKNYWHDNIDELDRLKIIDAICNQDNIFFDINLLRTLVKEYYTIILENIWWKSMGFDQGRLDLMRLKQKELIKERFKIEKAKAAGEGRKEFAFDGKVYPSGVDLKKQEKEREKLIKQNQNTTNTTGLGSNLLNNNPIK